MSAAAPLEARVAAALARVPAWREAPPRFALAAAPVASPLHRGVASDCVRVEPEGGAPVFLKIRHPDMARDVVPWAAEAARKAASLGVGPRVVLDEDGLLGLDYLPEPWRYARLGDLQDPGVMAGILDAKKRLHADAPLGRRFCPFARLDALAAEAGAAGVVLPDGTERLVGVAGLIREAIRAAGLDLAFCHNDGVASNVMLDGAGVRLVDFDLAGDNDPWFDVGVLINEACAFEAEACAAVEHYAGRFEERLLNRCRLYGALDDLAWGLWGVTRAATSARTGIEFHKYGTWRLLHARTTLGARGFETWLRRL
ncbi:hypothetical protein OPKNFCMD_1285 [Methylobacterium crusticola]|uniref:Aminoglycoside phosphotransferase domain-containing protein n=1 Tax=Methylobacterium crusticola TaxID=1697972 RepID=A0ABQ4QTB3_9HYPH|nr:phosphotransferase [Methylobacterium crusticola]GJD48563.1 hypothetical protein OPKNFCMD_1285 [Methylobacterium crusticola]